MIGAVGARAFAASRCDAAEQIGRARDMRSICPLQRRGVPTYPQRGVTGRQTHEHNVGIEVFRLPVQYDAQAPSFDARSNCLPEVVNPADVIKAVCSAVGKGR